MTICINVWSGPILYTSQPCCDVAGEAGHDVACHDIAVMVCHDVTANNPVRMWLVRTWPVVMCVVTGSVLLWPVMMWLSRSCVYRRVEFMKYAFGVQL
eukprot:1149267-Pelagomonas_calceolata.AAC.4